MTYIERKNLAIKLRKSGHSYSYIVSKIKVSKGTLSLWLKDIIYTPNKESSDRIGVARTKSAITKNKIKGESLLRAKKEATEEIGGLKTRDLFMLGIGLYIGEGTKTHNIVRVINANPKVIKLAIRWFTQCLGLSMSNFSIYLGLYPESNIDKSMTYWSKQTKIPIKQFGKTQIDTRKKKVSKRGKLPHGTAYLTVKGLGDKSKGVYLFRKISAYMDNVL